MDLLVFEVVFLFELVDLLIMVLECQIILEDSILQFTDLLQVWLNVLVHGRLFYFIFM